MSRKPWILVYAGASGHLEEIQPILSALSSDYEVALVTNPTAFVSRREVTAFVSDHGPSLHGQLLDLASAFAVGLRLIRRHSPALLFSAGPLPGLGVMIAARIRRVPCVYLDTFCRFRDISITGKFARLVASVTLVQWEHLLPRAGRHGAFWGRVV